MCPPGKTDLERHLEDATGTESQEVIPEDFMLISILWKSFWWAGTLHVPEGPGSAPLPTPLSARTLPALPKPLGWCINKREEKVTWLTGTELSLTRAGADEMH
jgi:hypothetical protein